MSLPSSKSTTVAGIVQEVLGRLPVEGETVEWHRFQFLVIKADQLGQLTVEMQLVDQEGAFS